jgi:hypothetical protein
MVEFGSEKVYGKATVKIGAETYKNISTVEVHCSEGKVDQMKLIGTGDKGSHAYGAKFTYTLSFDVPNYLRVEACGSIKKAYCEGRAEVFGSVKEANVAYGLCTGYIKSLAVPRTDKQGLAFVDEKSTKVLTFAEYAKQLGGNAGRATVVHIDGELDSIQIVTNEKLNAELVVHGNVGIAVVPHSFGVTKDIGVLECSCKAEVVRMPSNVRLIQKQ